MAKILVQGDMRDSIVGLCLEILQQVRREGGYWKSPWALREELKKLVAGNFPQYPRDEATVMEITQEFVAVRFHRMPPDPDLLPFIERVCRWLLRWGFEPGTIEQLRAIGKNGKERIEGYGADYEGRDSFMSPIVTPGSVAWGALYEWSGSHAAAGRFYSEGHVQLEDLDPNSWFLAKRIPVADRIPKENA